MDASSTAPAAIVVDPEFADLILPLDDDEIALLEANIVAHGCLEPLTVWAETGILVDGHNRKRICDQRGIPYQTRRLSFPDREAVKLWMIDNQLGRRNLPPYERSALALMRGQIVAAQAKTNQRLSPGAPSEKGFPNSGNLSEPARPVHTDRVIAELAGVGHDTIHKVKFIQNNATPELIRQLRREEISVHAAYQQVKAKQAGPKEDVPPAPVDHVAAIHAATEKMVNAYMAGPGRGASVEDVVAGLKSFLSWFSGEEA
jgi:hypothetical protein